MNVPNICAWKVYPPTHAFAILTFYKTHTYIYTNDKIESSSILTPTQHNSEPSTNIYDMQERIVTHLLTFCVSALPCCHVVMLPSFFLHPSTIFNPAWFFFFMFLVFYVSFSVPDFLAHSLFLKGSCSQTFQHPGTCM